MKKFGIKVIFGYVTTTDGKRYLLCYDVDRPTTDCEVIEI